MLNNKLNLELTYFGKQADERRADQPQPIAPSAGPSSDGGAPHRLGSIKELTAASKAVLSATLVDQRAFRMGRTTLSSGSRISEQDRLPLGG